MKHWYNPTTKQELHEVPELTDLEAFEIKSEALGDVAEPWCLECVVSKGKAGLAKKAASNA